MLFDSLVENTTIKHVSDFLNNKWPAFSSPEITPEKYHFLAPIPARFWRFSSTENWGSGYEYQNKLLCTLLHLHSPFFCKCNFSNNFPGFEQNLASQHWFGPIKDHFPVLTMRADLMGGNLPSSRHNRWWLKPRSSGRSGCLEMRLQANSIKED